MRGCPPEFLGEFRLAEIATGEQKSNGGVSGMPDRHVNAVTLQSILG